jgi:hypothetical protein
MYEFHTTQEATGTQPGETFDLDYSLLTSLPVPKNIRLQIGVAGYEQRQTTAKTGPTITSNLSNERYAVNAFGFASNLAFPRKVSLGLKFFKEFADRSTFQGFSAQLSGSLSF